MEPILISYNPILIFVAIILTFMATYTSMDLLELIRTTKKNKMYLFLGGTFSFGFGIWIMNFIGIMALDIHVSISYQVPIIILSIVIGICFTGMAFYSLLIENLKRIRFILSSLFMTLAVLSVHVIGMHALNMIFQFNVVLIIISTLIIFGSFLFSLRILLYTKSNPKTNYFWLKPISSAIITGAIVQGFFLLIRGTSLYSSQGSEGLQVTTESFITYLALFVAVLIFGGLIGSSTLINIRLTASDNKLRDISYALNESSIVAFTDIKGTITYVNDKFCEISKYDKKELIGSNHRILNSGTHSKDFFIDLWKTISKGETWRGEICNRAKDGTTYWVDTTIVPFLDEKNKPYQYLAIRNDITDRKQTEEILHRQDKLAAVGQLAAGVAHEIRNPLTSIKGYTEYLLLDEQNEDRKEYFDIILDEIERVNTIVEEFMVLAKPKAVELKEKNIIPIIQNVLALLDFEARKKKVSLKFEYTENIIQVECDENRLKQVFLNFIKNGIEAMPNGGDLTIRINIIDKQVQISIKDTGIGISKETIKKIGEPFYTTKKNGNGLGLMVSFKIIESHHGKVYIDSELNKGTTFNIVLPAKTA